VKRTDAFETNEQFERRVELVRDLQAAEDRLRSAKIFRHGVAFGMTSNPALLDLAIENVYAAQQEVDRLREELKNLADPR
jgi:transaldolase